MTIVPNMDCGATSVSLAMSVCTAQEKSRRTLPSTKSPNAAALELSAISSRHRCPPEIPRQLRHRGPANDLQCAGDRARRRRRELLTAVIGLAPLGVDGRSLFTWTTDLARRLQMTRRKLNLGAPSIVSIALI